MSAAAPPPHIFRWLAAGFGLWGSALVVLYALHALGCAFAWSAGPLRLGLAAVFLAHLGAIGWVWRAFAGGPDPAADETGKFLHSLVVCTLAAAFVTTGLSLGPPLVLAACT